MKSRILIVEDDHDILSIIDYLLTNAGYSTITSEDGEEIVSLIQETHPKLVLMDVRLGKNDGRELCKLVKQQHMQVPVVLMSAHRDLSDLYLKSCADNFIAKPFDIDQLVETVEHTLAKQSA